MTSELSEEIMITQRPIHKASDNTSLFSEMKALGIDPLPLLEIAAQDLLNQYGKNAFTYSIQIERNFKNDGDDQSAEIWQKISHYLQSMNGSGELITH